MKAKMAKEKSSKSKNEVKVKAEKQERVMKRAKAMMQRAMKKKKAAERRTAHGAHVRVCAGAHEMRGRAGAACDRRAARSHESKFSRPREVNAHARAEHSP